MVTLWQHLAKEAHLEATMAQEEPMATYWSGVATGYEQCADELQAWLQETLSEQISQG